MLDIGWSEMLIVGVVALVVVGPKDLPKMFHTIGQFTGKARGMAREFQRAMDVAAKEAGVDGFAKDIRKVTSGRAIKDAVGFDDIEKEFREIGRDVNDVRKNPKAKTMPKAAESKDAKANDAAAAEPDETEADELEVHAHDMDLAARNAEMSAVEEQRLKRAKQISAARQKAADLRARREAAEAVEAASQGGEPEEWRPTSKSSGATPPADSSPSTSSKPGEES